MGYAIKLGCGTGKRYEVACTDPVRGKNACWQLNYDTTTKQVGDPPEDYVNSAKLKSIPKTVRQNNVVATDGASYNDVYRSVTQQYELTRKHPITGVDVPAYDIVCGYFTRFYWGSGAHYKYFYVDYTKAKRQSSEKYPYIRFLNGHKNFSLNKVNNRYSAVTNSSPSIWIDTMIERPQPFDTICYVEEVTRFFRYNTNTTAWDQINVGNFNGSMFKAVGYRPNKYISTTIFNRPYNVLTTENIFYSYYSSTTSNNRVYCFDFTIYPNGTENNTVKKAPVVILGNRSTALLNFNNNSPFMIFGIREQIQDNLG